MNTYELSSLVINSLVALGTIAMAVAGFVAIWNTNKSIKVAKDSADAAYQSARATEASVDRMQDALMPYLDLNLKWDNLLIFSFRNVGAGLGKIRLVTTRVDIQYESIKQPTNFWTKIPPPFESNRSQVQLNNYVIAAGEECAFQLEPSTSGTFSPTDKTWLSSISVYYDDVYERIYRSRILYTWDRAQNIVKVVSKENYYPDNLPTDIINNFDIQKYWDIEGGRPGHYIPEFLNFHLLKSQKLMEALKVPGIPFTNNNNLILQKVIFLWNGRPIFDVTVNNFRAFKLLSSNENGQIVVEIHDVVDQKTRPFQEYGLLPEGKDEPRLVELYNYLLNTIRKAVDL